MNRPLYHSLTVAEAMKADWRGWHLSEKKDGVFHVETFAGNVVLGELMRDKTFHPFDVRAIAGEDISRRAWRDRGEALNQIMDAAPVHWHRIATGHGAEFIEAVLAKGGEGIVAKQMDAGINRAFIKIKRTETFDCTVTAKHHTKQSIALSLNGEPCGWCPCFTGFNRVRVGDVVEVAAMKRNPSGALREPRFLRLRKDKNETRLHV